MNKAVGMTPCALVLGACMVIGSEVPASGMISEGGSCQAFDLCMNDEIATSDENDRSELPEASKEFDDSVRGDKE